MLNARAGSSPGVAGEKGDGEVSIPAPANERRREVGDGGKSATALETASSNSSWVMLEREDESMVSMNWIAPAKEER
jgi:hypothetical protein